MPEIVFLEPALSARKAGSLLTPSSELLLVLEVY